MRTLGLAAAVAALALTAGPALAADPLALTQSAPSGRVPVAPMTDVTFSAGFAAPVEDAYVRISKEAPGPDGFLDSTVAGGLMTSSPLSAHYSWHLPTAAPIRTEPGLYWWQVVGSRRNDRGVLEFAASPAQRIDTYFPAAWSRRGPIDRRFGRHGHARFLLSTRDIPYGLDPARLKALVALSARRWGLRLTGWTSRSAGVQDRVNVAGFGPVPVDGALAVQGDMYAARYRVSQRCHNGTCGPIHKHFVGNVLTDQDLVIRPDVPWAMGPGRPPADEFDLESVLVHELGHLAGNKKHTARCANSPMGPSLGMGEWWRTPHDWYRRGCAPTQPGGLL